MKETQILRLFLILKIFFFDKNWTEGALLYKSVTYLKEFDFLKV